MWCIFNWMQWKNCVALMLSKGHVAPPQQYLVHISVTMQHKVKREGNYILIHWCYLKSRTLLFVENQPTFRRNMLLATSKSKVSQAKTYISRRQVERTSSRKLGLVVAGFFLSLLFNPEDRGDISLRNVSWFSKDFTALYPWRYNSFRNPLFSLRVTLTMKSSVTSEGKLHTYKKTKMHSSNLII
jgi:hypothetical protein